MNNVFFLLALPAPWHSLNLPCPAPTPCRCNLAYVHFVKPRAGGNADIPETPYALDPFRKARMMLHTLHARCEQQAHAANEPESTNFPVHFEH